MSCNLDPESLKATDSCETTGGMSKAFYYALPDDITSPFPAPPAAPANFAEAATIVADFTMEAGKTFHTIEADLQSTSLTSNSAGELNNLSVESEHKFRISGNNKTLTGWLNSYKNKDLIFAVPDNDGKIRILGNEILPAKVSAFSEVSGEKVGDNKVFEVTIMAYGNLPYFFEGPAGIPL